MPQSTESQCLQSHASESRAWAVYPEWHLPLSGYVLWWPNCSLRSKVTGLIKWYLWLLLMKTGTLLCLRVLSQNTSILGTWFHVCHAAQQSHLLQPFYTSTQPPCICNLAWALCPSTQPPCSVMHVSVTWPKLFALRSLCKQWSSGQLWFLTSVFCFAGCFWLLR